MVGDHGHKLFVDKAVLVINPLIYADISIRYSSVEELEDSSAD